MRVVLRTSSAHVRDLRSSSGLSARSRISATVSSLHFCSLTARFRFSSSRVFSQRAQWSLFGCRAVKRDALADGAAKRATVRLNGPRRDKETANISSLPSSSKREELQLRELNLDG